MSMLDFDDIEKQTDEVVMKMHQDQDSWAKFQEEIVEPRVKKLMQGKSMRAFAVGVYVPSDFRIDIECNYSDLYDMIDRASLLTSDKDKNTIKLELRNRELIISSNSPEIGKVEEKVSIENDDSISISFSSIEYSFLSKTYSLFVSTSFM